MVLRTRRQNRYTKLRQSGFLPFEARPLSRVPFKICPYMRQLIRDRQADFLEAKREGATRAQYENQIKEAYGKNKWLTERETKKGVKYIEADPWKMLRDYEDRFRDKHPEYESPWEPKWRNWQKALDKIERTMQKQRGLWHHN